MNSVIDLPYPPFAHTNHMLNELLAVKYLNYRNGIFVEAGAADGFQQSNTWNLEKFKNWSGVLIEPNVDAFNTCKQIRTQSKVYNVALVENSFKEKEVKMLQREAYKGDSGLMNTTSFSPLNEEQDWKNLKILNTYTIPAMTLDKVLQDSKIQFIDFLSLDVEGLELNVLNGFSIKKYLPKIVSIECHINVNEIMYYMAETHQLIEKVGNFDYIFALKYDPYGFYRDINNENTYYNF